MQSWIEISRVPAQALSPALSPSKWGSFADQICKKSNLIKGRSCDCNFGVESFLTSFTSYLENPLVLKVTAEVTAPWRFPLSKRWGKKKGGDTCP